MTYATVEDVKNGYRELDADEEAKAEALLEEASVIIDSLNAPVDEEVKKVVASRMVRRALGDSSIPMGATQGSMTAGSYSQSWTIGSSGSTGELYLSKLEKRLLRLSNSIGASLPLEVSND